MTIDSKKKVMSMGITMTRVIEIWLYHTYTRTHTYIHIMIESEKLDIMVCRMLFLSWRCKKGGEIFHLILFVEIFSFGNFIPYPRQVAFFGQGDQRLALPKRKHVDSLLLHTLHLLP